MSPIPRLIPYRSNVSSVQSVLKPNGCSPSLRCSVSGPPPQTARLSSQNFNHTVERITIVRHMRSCCAPRSPPTNFGHDCRQSCICTYQLSAFISRISFAFTPPCPLHNSQPSSNTFPPTSVPTTCPPTHNPLFSSGRMACARNVSILFSARPPISLTKMRCWSVDCYSLFRTSCLQLVVVYRIFGVCMLRPRTAITGHPYTRLVNPA